MSAPRILAFDTSGPWCAAALLIGTRIAASRHEVMAKGQSERLMPLLEETLAEDGAVWAELDAVAVGIGPGNFTGLRIAVGAARGLALSLGIPAIGVSGFEQLRGETRDRDPKPQLVTLPAPRGQVYAALFENGARGAPFLADPRDPDLGRRLPDGATILGHDADEVAHFAGTAGKACYPVAARIHRPAETVARIAARRLGEAGALPRPSPLYVRPPDAAPPSDAPPVILP